jgi:organic radical activating enzyme
MNKIIKIESNIPRDRVRIELFLSNVCNYKCWYCFPGSNSGTHPWPNLELVKKNLSYLIEYYKKNLNKKQIYLHIIGGEPTLWKDFGPFIKFFKEEHNCLISISTNGSRTTRWWNEYGHYVDQVMISCHHEYINVDHVIEVANILYKKRVDLVAMVLMDPNAWDKCLEIIKKLQTSKYKWPIAAMEVYHETLSYTDEQKEFLANFKSRSNFWYEFRSTKIKHPDPTITFEDGTKKTVEKNWLSLNNLNRFYGWHCNLGVDTLYIEKSGNIQGACGQNLYNLDFKYNLFDENFTEVFSPNIVPVICLKQTPCGCQPETNTRKSRYFVISNRI